MPVMNANMLRNIPLFELLDNDEVNALGEQLNQKHFWAGQVIFNQGDAGDAMYIVQSGKVELFIKDRNNEKVILGLVEPGELFGELSLLDSQPRSACARTLEDTLLVEVDHHDLEMLFSKHQHAAFDIMATLGRRIREADLLVGERVVARNPNDEMPKLSVGERVSDFLTMVAGDIRFVYFSLLWFATWISLNLGIIPGIEPFDPFPFGLLTMVVSLEAIFLSLFVLISQNRQAARDKVRNDIEYDVNIKAELEIRDLHEKVDKLQEFMISHLSRLNSNVDRIQTSTDQNEVIKNAKG